MKLWKIMLAVIVAVLMISCVAMAETHEHDFQKVEGSRKTSDFTSYTLAGVQMHQYKITWDTYCKCGAESTTSEWADGACVADWNDSDWVDATCKEAKHREGNCVSCGAYMYEKVGEKDEHDWHNYQTHPATCQNMPYYDRVCENCGKEETVYEGDYVPCEYTLTDQKIRPATCLQVAQFADLCKWCGDIKEGSIVNGTKKADCDYEWTTVIEPTCDTDGLKNGVCKVCGAKVQNVIASETKHVAIPSTKVTTWPTCTTWGKVMADCLICGKNFKVEDLKPIDHEGKTTTYNKVEATCGYEGHYTYTQCSACGMMWDYAGRVITEIPVIPANGKHILPSTCYPTIKDCTSTSNFAEGQCEVCGLWAREYIAASEHSFPAASNNTTIMEPSRKLATCTEDGYGRVKCAKCDEYKAVTIPAFGHKYEWTYGSAADCTNDLIAYGVCVNGTCGDKTQKVIEEALGHNWIMLDGGKDATCTENGKGTRMCTRCKHTQANVVIPATGHDMTKVAKVVAPTCTEEGYTVFTCATCGKGEQKGAVKAATGHQNYEVTATVAPKCGVAGSVTKACSDCGKTVTESVAALAHSYSWIVVSTPSASGNGRNEYKCANCGDVAEVKTIKYSKYYYNNTMTAYGPTTKELVGGNDWYRVTPVDTSVDGVYTYDLIASNRYVVGKVTISVNAGVMTVNYKVAASHVDVKDASLLIYASKADLAAGTAVTANVGSAINLAETFGADSKVIVSLVLTGDYDAAGTNVTTMVANDAEIASMIANID